MTDLNVPATDLLLEMYRRMVMIRRFEEGGERLYTAGKLIGSYHSSMGQEATEVGSALALKEGDKITGTHRSHGILIANGADPKGIAAEVLGRATGVCRGKGGSKHVADFSVGSLGASGIVASAMPVAVGAALGLKMQGKDSVVMCYFGDGACNEGLFHESLNLASVWSLPVVFICENNQYAVTTHYKRVTAVDLISKRAAAYDMKGTTVDGQNVLEVYDACRRAVDRARGGSGPSLVECLTYRYREHTLAMVFPTARKGGKAPYRSPWEVEQWKHKDPLVLFRSWLLSGEIAEEKALEALERECHERVEEAWQFALDSPVPAEAEIWSDTFVEPADAAAR